MNMPRSAPVDRRKHRRLDLELPVTFEILGENEDDTVLLVSKTCNVSTGGAYFIADCDSPDLKIDTKVRMTIESLSGQDGIQINDVSRSPRIEVVSRVLRIDSCQPLNHVIKNKVSAAKKGFALQFGEDLKVRF